MFYMVLHTLMLLEIVRDLAICDGRTELFRYDWNWKYKI